MAVAGPAVLLVASCAAAPWSYPTDALGYEWPEVCRQDLSLDPRVAPVPVYTGQKESAMQSLFLQMGGNLDGNKNHVVGLTLTWPDGTKMILVSEHIPEWLEADVIAHERCHVVAGNWHSNKPGHLQ